MSQNTQKNMNMMNPSIVNGANGDPVAKLVVQGIRTGSLNNKLNTVEEIVGEVQSKDAI